jgi:hypothetical protein
MMILLRENTKKYKKYLSYGGGVNSTALMILLRNKGVEFESVFEDHGGDYPETYAYVEMLQSKGYPITVIEAKVEGLNLYDYCLKYGILPSRQMRWCTDKFKIRHALSYYERPCIVYLGFDYDEIGRAKPSRDSGIENVFPLIDEGIDREGCKKIILKAGLPVPKKSGCYFCPFAKVKEFKILRDEYPDLWCKAKHMEQRAVDRRISQGKSPFYLRDKPLDRVVNEGQDDLFGWRKPCQCGQ